MAEQSLNPLRRESALDRPGSEEVAQRMEPLFRLALGIDDAGRALNGIEASVRNVGIALDVAVAVRKDAPGSAFRAGEPPFPERVSHQRRHRNFALASCRLRRPDL